MSDPFLIGRRVYLRLFDESLDAPAALRWWNHPAARQHHPAAALPASGLADVPPLHPHGALRFSVVLIEGQLCVGFACLRDLQPFQRRAELYVLVETDWQRRRIAHEAASLLIDHAFSRLGVDLLGARFDQGHEPARQLAQRLGFEPVATLPHWNLRDGRRSDELVWALGRSRLEQLRTGKPNPWSN